MDTMPTNVIDAVTLWVTPSGGTASEADVHRNTVVDDSCDSTNMTTDTHILEDAIDTVYNRPDTHGEPEDTFDTIAHLWQNYLWALGFNDASLESQHVADMMILLKVARNAEGHYHEDNYVDIAGYAENGARLNEGEVDTSEPTISDFDWDDKFNITDIKRGDYPAGVAFTAVPSHRLRAEGHRVKEGPFGGEFISHHAHLFKFGANYLFVPHDVYKEVAN